MTTVRIILAFAAIKNWDLAQLDVNNAFLYGELNEVVYMTPPPNFLQINDSIVYLLKKSLYGLKHASRQWFYKLFTSLLGFGFKKSLSDSYLFTIYQGNYFLALPVYVDDTILTGIEITRTKPGTVLDQMKHVLGLSKDNSLLGCKPVDFPMETTLKLSYTGCKLVDLYAAYRVLSDWASCVDTRRSVIGYCFFLGDSHISWKSKTNKWSLEAQLKLSTELLLLLVWLKCLLSDLLVPHDGPAYIYSDSKSALALAANPVHRERTKHIELNCHFICEKLHAGIIHTMHVYTKNQVADLLTKALEAQ